MNNLQVETPAKLHVEKTLRLHNNLQSLLDSDNKKNRFLFFIL